MGELTAFPSRRDPEPEATRPVAQLAPELPVKPDMPWLWGHTRAENDATKCQHLRVMVDLPIRQVEMESPLALDGKNTKIYGLQVMPALAKHECHNEELHLQIFNSSSCRMAPEYEAHDEVKEKASKMPMVLASLEVCKMCPGWKRREN